jgi:type IV secretion system protein VirB6
LGAAAIVAIAEFLMVAIGLGFFLLAKVALALVLAIGPVYILCAIWPSTEKYTESWIGQALNYVVLKVLVAVCILMLTDFASKFAAHINENPDAINVLRATMSLLICCGALAVVMLNLPQLSSALAGGASIAGIGRTIGRAFLDTMNKSGRSGRGPKPATGPESGPPKQTDFKKRQREQGMPRDRPPANIAPLYRRNTIQQIRKPK